MTLSIVHAIARLNVGGAALSVLELAAEQQRRGNDVLVVAGAIPAGEASMEQLAGELGVSYLHLPTLQRELSLRADAAAIRSLRSIIRARRPDVLHTHTAKAGATGRVAAVLSRGARPGVVAHTFHGHVLTGYFSPGRERIFRGVERLLASKSDALIAVSEEVRDDLVRLGVAPVERISVIPYGFDLDARVRAPEGARAAKRELLGLDETAFVAGWAGRLTAIKRPQDLVRIVAAVPDAQLVLAGDGELRQEVEDLAESLNAADRVRVLGYVDDIASWYSAFDVLLLVSANEGTPVVAIEALAAGVPVVATDAGGTRTVVDDGETGFLAAVADTDALAERLRRLQLDGGLRATMGAEGARRMRERFSIGRMTDDVDRLYHGALGR